nr:hypothetical protein [Tanacetum cinerariifolium]
GVATACYTQNRSIVCLHHGKTPYDLLHDKLLDLSFFHVFGALCYPTNDSENLDFDELTAMASEHSSSGPALHDMTPTTIGSGLVPNTPPSTPFVPHSRTDWDILFQLLFDELLTPPSCVDHPSPEVSALIAKVVAPEPAASFGSPSSTTVNQDAPSPSNSQTTPETQSPIIPNDVKEDNHDLDVAHMNNDPFFGIPILEVLSDQSSSTDIIHTIMHPDHQIFKHNSKWTKDHPLENIIGKLARPVSTRLQLHEPALFCYYDAFLIVVEPKMYKDALTQSYWIEAMQEELNEFERLGLWELVPRLDKVMVITLKWIYKVNWELVDLTYNLLYACVPDIRLALPKSTYMRSKGSFDVDHAGCQDIRRSTSGSMQFLGDRLVRWMKHIDIRYHFIKEHVKNGVIELYFVNTEYQLTNIFNKALGRERIEFLINKLEMRSFTSETLKHLADEVEE